jgi:hypothetical protein
VPREPPEIPVGGRYGYDQARVIEAAVADDCRERFPREMPT